jgi:hypothetical protein
MLDCSQSMTVMLWHRAALEENVPEAALHLAQKTGDSISFTAAKIQTDACHQK